MFTSLKITPEFAAVPHLANTTLMANHPAGISFSTAKPNVIVGPNGAGKSALMKTLSIKTLSHMTGRSCLDKSYFNEKYWKRPKYSWLHDYEFLPGLILEGEADPTLFYRPGHIPGNREGIAHAMMAGYFEEAKSFGLMTKDKSTGQQHLAALAALDNLLDGYADAMKYGFANWDESRKLLDLKKILERPHVFESQVKAELLKQQYLKESPSETAIMLGDEPEQSLDARAAIEFWKRVANIDSSKVQVIIASHSLYPIQYPDRFNIIEAEPGYLKAVQRLLD